LREKKLLYGAACGLALALAAGAGAQEVDPAKVEVKTVPVAEGLAMIVGAGGNLALAWGADGALLVDDQYAPMTDKIRAAVAALTDRPLRFVVNTHWHGDHTGGNENLGRAGALIVAHENVRVRMSTEQFLKLWNERVPASPPGALPVVTFDASVSFHLAGGEVRVEHVPPAHTDGDAFVRFARADALHAGDLFFNGMYPYIDLDSGGSLAGLIAAVDRMLALCGPATKIVPGHGPLATPDDLRRYREMLIGVRDAVAPLVAAGRSVEQVVAAKPTSAWDEAWGSGFMKPDVFAGIVARSLGAQD
jgi:glyoxylase-like metal-dependent hydrolase (beta-lactamase superfamily II)